MPWVWMERWMNGRSHSTTQTPVSVIPAQLKDVQTPTSPEESGLSVLTQ